MIIEYIRYTIDDARRSAFEEAYAQAGTALLASSHCLGYELSACVEEPTSFVLRIEWDSLEGHMNGFRTSPQVPPFFAAIGPFVHDIQEMRHYEMTRVTGTKP